jgi:hypothetical protein
MSTLIAFQKYNSQVWKIIQFSYTPKEYRSRIEVEQYYSIFLEQYWLEVDLFLELGCGEHLLKSRSRSWQKKG